MNHMLEYTWICCLILNVCMSATGTHGLLVACEFASAALNSQQIYAESESIWMLNVSSWGTSKMMIFRNVPLQNLQEACLPFLCMRISIDPSSVNTICTYVVQWIHAWNRANLTWILSFWRACRWLTNIQKWIQIVIPIDNSLPNPLTSSCFVQTQQEASSGKEHLWCEWIV